MVSRYKKLFKSLKIRWNNSQMALNFSLHNFIGVITLPFLLVVAVTGMLFPFQEKIEESLKLNFKSNYPEELKSIDKGKGLVGLDKISSQIKKLHPDGELYKMRFPSDKSGVIEVQLNDGSYDPEGKGNTSEFFDQFSGKHIGTFSKHTETTYDKFFVWRQSLHRGTFGGLFTKIIYSLVGIAPLGLGITGVTMWALKRKNKSKKFQKLQQTA
ncbi:PepSY-associated TM helix domain-containing protein [Bacillus sp. JJ664]